MNRQQLSLIERIFIHFFLVLFFVVFVLFFLHAIGVVRYPYYDELSLSIHYPVALTVMTAAFICAYMRNIALAILNLFIFLWIMTHYYLKLPFLFTPWEKF